MIKYNRIIYILLSLIIILAYFRGALEIIGIEQFTSRLIIQLLIVALFILSLFKMSVREKFIINNGLLIGLIGLFFTILISFLLNDYGFKYLLLFIKEMIFPFIFIISLINIELPKLYLKKSFRLLIALAIIQILATIIKLFSVGIMESYIGTMSIKSGSIATIFPLMAISFIWVNYLYSNKKRLLLYIIPFMLIGLASAKLAIVPYAIVIISILSIFRYSIKKLLNYKIYLNIIIIVSISLIMIYAFGRMNPRINTENIFDKNKIIVFVARYITRDLDASGYEGSSRLVAVGLVFERIRAEGISHILFGMGPGHIVKSRFNYYVEPLRSIYGFGYGARTGFIWIFLQIGLIGVVLFTFIHLRFLQILLKYNKKRLDYKSKVMTLTAIGCSVIFFIDYFTYSSITILHPTIYITYYYIIYYGLSTNRINRISKG